jgi:hypothetical protein
MGSIYVRVHNLSSIYVSVHNLSHELSFQGYNKWASKIRGLEFQSRAYSLLGHYSLFYSLWYIGQGFAREERGVGFGFLNLTKTCGKLWPFSSHFIQPMRVICIH